MQNSVFCRLVHLQKGTINGRHHLFSACHHFSRAIACRRHCSSVFHGYRSKVLALGFGDHLPRRGVGHL
jgi:hypothetical protein